MMEIDAMKRRLLVKYPFFGSVVANLDYAEMKECPTAATDGKTVYYNPDFIETLSEDEKIFVLAHEVCHVAFDHVFRSEGKDKRLWNIATDAVINQLLKKDGLPLIQGGVDISETVNYDAEEMYEKLVKEKEQQQQQGGETQKDSEDKQRCGKFQDDSKEQKSGEQRKDLGESKGKAGMPAQEKMNESLHGEGGENGENIQEQENADIGHDTHEMWDKAIKERKEQEKSGESKEKKSLLDKLFGKAKVEEKSDEKKDSPEEKQKKQRIKKLSEMGEKKAFEQNKIERKRQLEEFRESLAKESMGAGDYTNSQDRVVKAIGTAEALLDWRKVLKEAINAEVDWSYKDATIEEGVVTPHLEELPLPETEIVLDTSGSIDETLLRNFLRECKNILQNSKVKVGCFDVDFYGFTDIRSEKDIDNMSFCGGGGTNFNVAVNAFSRRVENKIIFTDGDAPMPSKAIDAIWIVFGNREISPRGGRVIRITTEQLRKLYRQNSRNMGVSR